MSQAVIMDRFVLNDLVLDMIDETFLVSSISGLGSLSFYMLTG